MEAVLIECVECKALNRLSRGFPEQLKGQVGELACFRCGGPIEVDLTGSSPALRGGILVVAAEVALAQTGRTSTSLSPHTLDATPEGEAKAPFGRKGAPPFRRADTGYLADAEVLSSPEPSLPSSSLQGSLDEGSLAGGSAADGSAADGSAADGSAADGSAEEPATSGDSGVEELAAEEPTNPRAAAAPLTEGPEETSQEAAARSGSVDHGHEAHHHGDVHPPRPWELEEQRKSAPPAQRDENLGLRPLEAFTGVRLTTDGRLINEADGLEKRSKQRFWLPLGIAAAGLIGVIAGMQRPHLWGNAPLAQAPSHQEESSAVPVVSSEGTADDARADQGTPETESDAAASSGVAEVPEIDELAREAVKEAPKPARPAPSQMLSRAPARTWTKPSEAAATRTVPVKDTANVLPKTATDEAELPLPSFSKDAASAALERAGASAASCRKADDPYGSAQVMVTFAPSGRVTSAIVSGHPFAGTEVGGCIANRLRTAQVPPFSGDFVSVSKTVVVQ